MSLLNEAGSAGGEGASSRRGARPRERPPDPAQRQRTGHAQGPRARSSSARCPSRQTPRAMGSQRPRRGKSSPGVSPRPDPQGRGPQRRSVPRQQSIVGASAGFQTEDGAVSSPPSLPRDFPKRVPWLCEASQGRWAVHAAWGHLRRDGFLASQVS